MTHPAETLWAEHAAVDVHKAEVQMLHDACALAGITTQPPTEDAPVPMPLDARATLIEPGNAPDPVVLARIQELFHGLIRSRAREGGIPMPKHLPSLHDLRVDEAEPRWFAVPGMYGGFSFRLQAHALGPRIVTESWCRVVDGSGMRHTITPTQVVLDEQGFV
ncbi:MAG: hypothetical protein WCJ66_16680 [Verrucomicrobiota bacterium]